MSFFLDRFIRAAKLDTNLYEDVAADKGAMTQAMMVVFIYSLSAAFGSFGKTGMVGINIGMITTLLGWYIWAFFTYFIGTRLLPESQTSVDRKTVLRTMGFASAPGVIRLLGFFQGLGGVAVLIASVWMIAAAVIAVKKALNYTSTLRAVGICIFCWIISAVVQVLLFILLFSVFGVSAKPF